MRCIGIAESVVIAKSERERIFVVVQVVVVVVAAADARFEVAVVPATVEVFLVVAKRQAAGFVTLLSKAEYVKDWSRFAQQ